MAQQPGSDGDQLEPTFTPRARPKLQGLEDVGHVLVIMSGKGGVGKSTVAVNLALALQDEGLSVGLADLDITNPNTPRMTGLADYRFETTPFEPPTVAGMPVASASFFTPKGKALAWRGPMKQKMISQLLGRVQWGSLDVLVLDLPPGTSDEPLSVGELVATEKLSVVLVTTPQGVSTDDVALNFKFAVDAGMPVVAIIENMSGFECSCGEFHPIFGEGGGQRLAELFEVPLVAQIPLASSVREAGDEGKPMVLRDPDGPAARAIRGAAEALLDRVGPDDA